MYSGNIYTICKLTGRINVYPAFPNCARLYIILCVALDQVNNIINVIRIIAYLYQFTVYSYWQKKKKKCNLRQTRYTSIIMIVIYLIKKEKQMFDVAIKSIKYIAGFRPLGCATETCIVSPYLYRYLYNIFLIYISVQNDILYMEKILNLTFP